MSALLQTRPRRNSQRLHRLAERLEPQRSVLHLHQSARRSSSFCMLRPPCLLEMCCHILVRALDCIRPREHHLLRLLPDFCITLAFSRSFHLVRPLLRTPQRWKNTSLHGFSANLRSADLSTQRQPASPSSRLKPKLHPDQSTVAPPGVEIRRGTHSGASSGQSSFSSAARHLCTLHRSSAHPYPCVPVIYCRSFKSFTLPRPPNRSREGKLHHPERSVFSCTCASAYSHDYF